MSPARRRSNGAKPSPVPSQDDTEPMTQAEAPPPPADPPPSAESSPAAAAGSEADEQGARGGSAEGPSGVPAPAAGSSRTAAAGSEADGLGAKIGSVEDPSEAPAPAAGSSRTAAAGSEADGRGAKGGSVEEPSDAPAPVAESSPAGVVGSGATAAPVGAGSGASQELSTPPAGIPATGPADGAQSAAPGVEGGSSSTSAAVGAAATAAAEVDQGDADGGGSATDAGAEGPSADESLSVEMAAGRVQQPSPQRRSRQRGVRAALATLPVPEPGPSFWADLDAALADQQPLAIAARPAIRPITEPPPLSQPKLSDYLESTNVSGERVRRSRDDSPGSDLARPPGRVPDFGLGGSSSGRGRKLLAAIVVIVLGLLVAGTIMGDGDDEPSTSAGDGAGADDQPTTTPPPPDAAPTTAPAVPGLEPEARLTAAGIGPLQVGLTLGEITAAGVTVNVDQPTFDANDGACYDGRPGGAADLTLRFHGPEPGVGVADPAQGVLGAVSIRDVDGSLRVTTTEVGLGATEELVRDAHAGALEVSDNPSQPGGHIYLARSADDPDLGIAYATDGSKVTEISVGVVDLIGVNQACI